MFLKKSLHSQEQVGCFLKHLGLPKPDLLGTLHHSKRNYLEMKAPAEVFQYLDFRKNIILSVAGFHLWVGVQSSLYSTPTKCSSECRSVCTPHASATDSRSVCRSVLAPVQPRAVHLCDHALTAASSLTASVHLVEHSPGGFQQHRQI